MVLDVVRGKTLTRQYKKTLLQSGVMLSFSTGKSVAQQQRVNNIRPFVCRHVIFENILVIDSTANCSCS